MNKSILFGTVIIVAAIIASPFIHEKVKLMQREASYKSTHKRAELMRDKANYVYFENIIDMYKLKNGKCPSNIDDLKSELKPRDRKLISTYIYDAGNCELKNSKGETWEELNAKQ